MKKQKKMEICNSYKNHKCPLTMAFIFQFFLLFSPCAEARVFNFENETVAPFFSARGGLSQLENDPYAWQSASQYSGDEFDLLYGGEFGLYLRGAGMGLRVGVLVQTFDEVVGGLGSDGSGQALYSATSSGMLFGPSVAFDFQFAKKPSHLWKFVVGGGYQWGEFDNDYSVTAAGQALVGGLSQFSETYKAQVYYAMVGVAGEIVLANTTTMEFLFGYHHSFSGEWKYSGSGQNFAGSYQEGARVNFEDGAPKTLNLSYPFLQVGFNFYIDLVR